MAQTKTSDPASPPQSLGLTRQGKTTDRLVPAPPPMQVVTKGWWTLRKAQATVNELEKAERGRR